MKAITKSCGLLLISVAGLVSCTSAPDSSRSQNAACFQGHITLKEIPVVYGQHKDPKRIERDVRDYKVWDGGSGRDQDSPERRLICTTCGYAMHPVHGFWERKGTKPSDFSSPLTPLVAALPLPEVGKRSREVSFHQYRKQDGGLWENVVVRSTEPFLEVWARVKTHLDSIDPRLSESALLRDGKADKYLETRWNDYDVEVEVAAVPAYQDTYVRVSARRGVIWKVDSQR